MASGKIHGDISSAGDKQGSARRSSPECCVRQTVITSRKTSSRRKVPERLPRIRSVRHYDNPWSFYIFSRSWERLPPELHNDIDDILGNTNNRSIMSKLALVSQAWSRRFRPRLFMMLELRSEADVRFLYEALRSSASAWLKDHIARLNFTCACFPNHPLCTALLKLLPKCHILDADRLFMRAHPNQGRILRQAALKSALRHLTSLTLRGYRFPSFPVLLRILADISHLEALFLWRVTWSGEPPATVDATSDMLSGAFPRIRRMELFDCTGTLALGAWVFAAASTRHVLTRRRTPAFAMPSETWAIIVFITTCLNNHRIQCSKFNVMEDSQDAYTFVMSVSASPFAGSPFAYLALRVSGRVKWTCATTPKTWSVTRIALADAQVFDSHSGSKTDFDYLRCLQWDTVLSALAACPRLQAFEVICGSGRSSDSFLALSEDIRDIRDAAHNWYITTEHDPYAPDGRFLRPELFGVSGKRYCVMLMAGRVSAETKTEITVTRPATGRRVGLIIALRFLPGHQAFVPASSRKFPHTVEA